MFSVVVPVYNHQSFVSSALISAAQSPLVSEVLAVDDGSTDHSSEIIRELASSHPKITIQPGVRPGNLGAHVRLNELVRSARNEWIAVLNSDDEFVPGRFEVIERSTKHDSVDLYFGDMVIIDQQGDRLGFRRSVTNGEYPWPNWFDACEAADNDRWVEMLLQQNILATTTNMVFNRSIFERVGGFRPYRYCHDWDFVLRVALSGAVKYVPLMLSRYRVHRDNTISEKRVGVEREVIVMMGKIGTDFPVIIENPLLNHAYLANRYLFPTRAFWFEIVRGSNTAFVAAESALQATELDARFVDSPSKDQSDGSYIYAPGAGISELTMNDLRNLRLACAVRSYDVFLISRALEISPSVGSGSLQDLIVYNRRWTSSATRRPAARLVRLLPAKQPPKLLKDFIDVTKFHIDHALADTYSDTTWPAPAPLPVDGLGKRPEKPTVFIFPIFLAMGGAERLVVETMRHLVSKYHFVIVNTEPLLPQHGSIHGEALQYADVYDIAETVRADDRLDAIELLKRHYNPAVVWITNGSPWQVAKARQLRNIFDSTPIVDNQAYDHENGWILSFNDPDIRSSDRFVAINSRIRTVMVDQFGVPNDRIDLVYHGANISHLKEELKEPAVVAATRLSLGLPPEGLIFGMVGRLTSQKRPQDLVQLAARMHARGHKQYHFCWAGPGEMRDEMERLRTELDAENFSLLPPMQDVRPLYRSLDGLIVTSEFEGLPFVVLEALALGVPILSTPVGAIEEVLTAYGSGQISGLPGDLDALEAAFLKFVEDLPTLRAIANSRRIEFIDQFSSERMAAEYDASWTQAIDAFAGKDRGLN